MSIVHASTINPEDISDGYGPDWDPFDDLEYEYLSGDPDFDYDDAREND